MEKTISMNHGSGGRIMHSFVNDIILSKLGNPILSRMDDAAVLSNKPGHKIAFTTDSYVVSPLFFPGGDIGRLAVCGTVNDLATSGAKPLALTLSFIIEEGMELESIEKIVDSIAQTAKEAGVSIVTGDTKVVEKGKGDKIYINTAGVGFIKENIDISTHNAKPGDSILINGPIGNHEVALFLIREEPGFTVEVKSDAAPLNKMVEAILEKTDQIRVIKDPTRGGVASALHEIVEHSKHTILIDENAIPVDKAVSGVCELVGFDPLYLANEGKFIVVCSKEVERLVLAIMGPQAKKIGIVKKSETPQLLMETKAGGIRRLSMLENVQLPRIC
jgi:hydrogenase expression/formation protein HypE